jgi:hypothetical protein
MHKIGGSQGLVLTDVAVLSKLPLAVGNGNLFVRLLVELLQRATESCSQSTVPAFLLLTLKVHTGRPPTGRGKGGLRE